MEAIERSFEEVMHQANAFGNTILGIGIAFAIIPYVLFAIGLSSVAKRYRIRNQWMAWLPIARKHLLAELADLRRVKAGKRKKLETQFEIISVLCLACIYGTSRISNPIFAVVPAILMVLLTFNQIFAYYYFYRLCDQENATIYFLLGLIISPLNAIFVYHCR